MKLPTLRHSDKPQVHIPFKEDAGVVDVTRYKTQVDEFASVVMAANVHTTEGRSVGILFRTNAAAEMYRHERSGGAPRGWRHALAVMSFLANPSSTLLARAIIPKGYDVGAAEREARETGGSLFTIAIRNGWLPPFREELLIRRIARYNVEPESMLAIDAARCETLPDLLAWANSQQWESNEEGLITVSTYHGSKGREFDVVFMPAFEKSQRKSVDTEDERRLAFVAVTRAKAEVHISWHAQRKAQWGVVKLEPSPMIEEMGLAVSW